MRTDDFTRKTKRQLAHRVGHRCSNPECQASTSGPGLEEGKLLTAGDAAHITAASPAGPRFDPLFNSQQRRSYDNGIWLCVNCARIIDHDHSRYSVDLLRGWKSQAEELAKKDLGRPQASNPKSRAEVRKFARISKMLICVLKNRKEESTMLGIEAQLNQMAEVALSLGIPVPVEIHTIPYPKGIVPHNLFLKDRLEGMLTIRLPDGSEESGKAAHASGLELLIEARYSAIASLQQWCVLIEDQLPDHGDIV